MTLSQMLKIKSLKKHANQKYFEFQAKHLIRQSKKNITIYLK